MLGKNEGGRRTATEDEMVGWHHCLDGNEFDKALGVGDGQGSPRLLIIYFYSKLFMECFIVTLVVLAMQILLRM